MKLKENHDPMGQAIRDYFEKKLSDRLHVLSYMFDEDEIPVQYLFRLENAMPKLERHALRLCKGRVLDVGAGAGSHSLVLQSRNVDVTAIDISPLSVETMRRRGVDHAEWADFYTDDFGKDFDTMLFLMNGLGIAGTLKQLPDLLRRCCDLLAPDGCILADSSDLRYIYEDEDGNFDPSDMVEYYGETKYWMEYKKCKGHVFDWLYVDFDTLKRVAATVGLRAELVKQGDHYDYLARLTREK